MIPEGYESVWSGDLWRSVPTLPAPELNSGEQRRPSTRRVVADPDVPILSKPRQAMGGDRRSLGFAAYRERVLASVGRLNWTTRRAIMKGAPITAMQADIILPAMVRNGLLEAATVRVWGCDRVCYRRTGAQ